MNIPESLIPILNIHYIKACFTVKVTSKTVFPQHKASALRGGLGQMLLRDYCIQDRACDSCLFSEECIVQRMMYSKYDIKPSFVTQGESIGYCIECSCEQTHFSEGESFTFNLLLFGKSIMHLPLFYKALARLGKAGIGRDDSKYTITDVSVSDKSMMQNGRFVPSSLSYSTLADYVAHRLEQLSNDSQLDEILFISPLSYKFQGEQLSIFQITALTKAIQRRIYMFNCYEGNNAIEFLNRTYEPPSIMMQSVKNISIKRYSNRKKSPHFMNGITGSLTLNDPLTDELLVLFIAGELLHIGAYTAFGFGQYIIKQ